MLECRTRGTHQHQRARSRSRTGTVSALRSSVTAYDGELAYLIILDGGTQQTNVLVQCQNCHGVSLVIGTRRRGSEPFTFLECFPRENPENTADKSVPENVRADFIEALRCRGIRAYKAAVVMCRRALQSSCQDLKANGKNLISQIDDLASKGSITKPLQDMAHQIRKLGNAGAHPNDDALNDVTPDDGNDIIEFTVQYFEHIYVMPAKMASLARRRTPVPEVDIP